MPSGSDVHRGMSLYCTTFCNHPHYVDNGQPYKEEPTA